MSVSRLWAIMRKEFRHVQRDRRLFFLVIVSPTIMLLAFAYLFSFDATTTRLILLDRDHSPQSRALVQAIATDPDLVIVGEAVSQEELRRAIRAGRVKLALVIPPDFGATLAAGRQAQVLLQGDGADPINSSIEMAALAARLQEWAQAYQPRTLIAPVEVRTLVWYNPDLKSSDSMVPALLAVVLILPAMAVGLAVTREKELGSFESLATTPVRASEYILGKLIPYIIYGLVGAALAIAVSLFWFHVPLRGSVLALAVLTAIYLWASLGISIFIAGFLSTQSTALRAILLIFLVPSFFLTGIVIPIDEQARLTANSLPATHFVAISRGLFLKGLSWQALGPHVFALLVMGTFSVAGAILTFHKRVR
ncbi:MAG: ABC transporter permease [Caldilineae bacterium]|nr:MAG: ABC transporter permease [Caldilineae bacterium]